MGSDVDTIQPSMLKKIIFDRYLIWIGSDQEKTFGPTISGLIHNNLGPERVTLWDSKKRGASDGNYLQFLMLRHARSGGRPDVMKLIKETYVSWGAEVIFITSNLQGNTEMMEGCKEAGIPAFVSASTFVGLLLFLHCMDIGDLVGFLDVHIIL